MGRSLRVSEAGLKRAKEAFQLTGWTQDYLAGSVKCTRQTVNKFLAGGDVEKRFFEALCRELNLRVADIADDESHEFNDKWRLVQEIVSEPVDGRKLRGADLRGANLSGADLSGAAVENALFGDNLGLTEEMKLDLKQRGAIFEDSLDDCLWHQQS